MRNVTNRVLVLSASVGAGHLRAAQAVEAALRQIDPGAVVRNVDVLELTNAAFRRVYGQAYLDLVNRAPHVLGYFYDWLDRPSPRPKPRSPSVSPGRRLRERLGASRQSASRQSASRAIPPDPRTESVRGQARRKSDLLRSLVETVNLRAFLRFLKEEPWDVIVNTHFLPAEMIAGLRRKGELGTPQLIATTDFETHRLWVNQPCDHYFTATEEGAVNLQHWGVPAKDTTASGIPIDPVFHQPKERSGCLERQGLVGDRPVILQLAGGFGVGPVEAIHRALLAVDVPLEIVVVAGRNEKLRGQLSRVEPSSRHRVKLLGFTDQIDELMAAADVVVSKPGGLTTSEVLARGAAMAIVNPIPGQESRNSDFLLENGAAVKINNLSTLPYKLSALLDDPRRLARLKENARRLGRPRAALDIARKALDDFGASRGDRVRKR